MLIALISLLSLGNCQLHELDVKGPELFEISASSPTAVSQESIPLKPLPDAVLPPSFSPPLKEECSYDLNKWATRANSTIIRVIMFHRTTGGSCSDCLNSCLLHQTPPWVCRSVVFDRRWNICDLFAVTASNSPFDMVTFEGRQYFEYLPAMPPTDNELQDLRIYDHDQITQATCRPSMIQITTEGPKLYAAKSELPQSDHKEKDKKRNEKRKRKYKKQRKEMTTTTENPTSALTTSTWSALWNMENKILKGKNRTDVFTTMKPKRLVFKRPRGNKTYGARTSLTDELAGFVDINNPELSKVVSSGKGCTEDDVVAMVEFISTKRRRPFGGDVSKVNSSNTEECSEACEKDNDCSSALFSAIGCQLASTKSRRTRTGRGRLFSAVRNFLLVGFVEEVEDAKSMEDCIALCLKARRQHGFHCLSAMFYPVDKEQNCVLNREAGSRKADQFIKADQSIQMIYIEVPDAVDVREAADESFKYRDDPLRTKWTVWSSCEGKDKDGLRYRYNKCFEEKDVRKCSRETAFCGSNPLRGPTVRMRENDSSF